LGAIVRSRSQQSAIRAQAQQLCLLLAGLVFNAVCGSAVALAQTSPLSPARSSEQDWQEAEEPQADLTKTSIEDLMNIEVISVSKKEEKVSRTAAAIFVITSEDIRRSGATNIPDLLRMVPGMDVAQINANTWAISARGFNAEFSNALLVLVDGRNVYTPTFGGVFWDTLDVPLEDIERIEVIRGPGASVWGANAVNGVVNIITKKASETKGAMLVTGGGNLDQGFGTAQYGDSLGKETDYRVYSNYFNQNHLPSLTGQQGDDGWHLLQAGFRADSTLSSKDALTVAGDLYAGREGDPTTALPSITSPELIPAVLSVDLSGGFLQGIWNHEFSQRSATTLMASYDRYGRMDQLGETRQTFDLDFQNHIGWGNRQDFVWGLDFRDSWSQTTGDLFVSLNPKDVTFATFSSFVQDEVTLVPDHWTVTAGTKLEHNYYTDFALMPSIRTAYTLNTHQTVWAAVSHAVRTPAEIDESIQLDVAGFLGAGGTQYLVAVLGNPNFKNEELLAYELGYRTMVNDDLSLDVAAFYHDYSNQLTTEPSAPFFETTPAPPHVVLPYIYENLAYGEEHGLELAANWKVSDRWTISPGYDFARIHMISSPLSDDNLTPVEDADSDPHVQAQLRSHLQLSKSWDWNTTAYFVDRVALNNISSYTRLDTSLSWRWRQGLSLSVVGQNLLRDHHLEFIDTTGASRSTEIKRSAYAKLTWQF
jgi:iron complex outermembrane recepter protein